MPDILRSLAMLALLASLAVSQIPDLEIGTQVAVEVATGTKIHGTVRRGPQGWLALDRQDARVLVQWSHIVSLTFTKRDAEPAEASDANADMSADSDVVRTTYRIDEVSRQRLRKEGKSEAEALRSAVRSIHHRIRALGLDGIDVRLRGSRIEIEAAHGHGKVIEELLAPVSIQLPIVVHSQIHGHRASRSFTLHRRLDDGSREAFRFDPQRAEALLAEAKDLSRPVRYTTAEGHATPLWWKPLDPRQAAEVLDRPEATVRNALGAAAAGRPYVRGNITGAWLYYDPEWFGPDLPGFTHRDVQAASAGTSASGGRTVRYRIRADRVGDFSDYTGKYVGKGMAVVIDDRVRTSPIINEALGRDVQISGGVVGFTEREQQWLVAALGGNLGVRLEPTAPPSQDKQER